MGFIGDLFGVDDYQKEAKKARQQSQQQWSQEQARLRGEADEQRAWMAAQTDLMREQGEAARAQTAAMAEEMARIQEEQNELLRQQEEAVAEERAEREKRQKAEEEARRRGKRGVQSLLTAGWRGYGIGDEEEEGAATLGA